MGKVETPLLDKFRANCQCHLDQAEHEFKSASHRAWRNRHAINCTMAARVTWIFANFDCSGVLRAIFNNVGFNRIHITTNKKRKDHMATKRIVLTYTNNAKSKKHQIVAKVQEGSKTPEKTRTFSIGRDRNETQAYEEAIKVAKALAKEFKAELGEIPSIEELMASGESIGSRKPSAGSQPKQNALVEKFNHLSQFRALINHGIRTHGAEKMADILNTGLEIVREAQEEEKRNHKIVYEANRKIAEAVLEAREKGVQMPASPEVESMIDEIIAQRARRKPNSRYAGSSYMLNGEPWDGNGQMPASYAKWLAEDEKRDVLSLKVG